MFIIISASYLINFYAELMHVIASCLSGNTASKVVAVFKKPLQIIQKYLDEMNIFFYFIGTSFLFHMTAQQNKLSLWHRK